MEAYRESWLHFFSMLYPLETLMDAAERLRSGRFPADRFLRTFPCHGFTDPDRIAEAYGSKRLKDLRGHLAACGASPLVLCPLGVLEEQRGILKAGGAMDGGEGSPMGSLEAVESAIAMYDSGEAESLRREEFFYWLGVGCVTGEQHDREHARLDMFGEASRQACASGEAYVERYFITDDHLTGTMVAGRLDPGTVLLLLGALCLDGADAPGAARVLSDRFRFSVEAEGLTFAKLNEYIRYPYGCGDLVKLDESVVGALYQYSNVLDVKRKFSGKDAEAMLRSLDLDRIEKRIRGDRHGL